MFAKLFETDKGQVLVKKDEGEEGAEVRIFFSPPGYGVCSVALNWQEQDKETQWKNADKEFERMTKEIALKLLGGVTDFLYL